MSPDDLKDRIEKARAASVRRDSAGKAPASDAQSGKLLGAGVRVGVEFASAVIVGAGLGLLIDHWCGTSPFGLLILLLVGFGAGLMSLKRFMGA